jgi:hypothetical protein
MVACITGFTEKPSAFEEGWTDLYPDQPPSHPILRDFGKPLAQPALFGTPVR